MSLPAVISDYSTGAGSGVDADHQVKVVTNTDPAKAGAMVMFSENDNGSFAGSRLLRSPETSQDYRLRVGTDTILFRDEFNATSQNISNWSHAFTTMTMTQSGGFLNANAAGTSTVSGNFAYLKTWRYFPLFGTAPVCVEIRKQFDKVIIANEVFSFGLGNPTTGADPIEGAWIEYTSSYGVCGVVRYNSGTVVRTFGSIMNTPSINTTYKFTIVVGQDQVDFWVDDAYGGTIVLPAVNALPFLNVALPVFDMKYNLGVVATSPNVIGKTASVVVTLMDLQSNQTWANQMASCGLGMQQLNGGSAGSPQVQWANTALPTAAAATNTTAALGAFLGGLFQMNAPATSATDVIIASYQNPAGSATQTPRTMKLRGIKIDCVNQVVAVATTASVFAVAVAWGGSSVTLAATESTSFQTGTTKLRRVQPIGVVSFPVAAAVGAQATPLQFDFEAPLVINPGEYVQVICKIILGTATATETFLWVVSPNLYHE